MHLVKDQILSKTDGLQVHAHISICESMTWTCTKIYVLNFMHRFCTKKISRNIKVFVNFSNERIIVEEVQEEFNN